MANNFMVNVPENFDLEEFADEVAQQYQAKGFQVNTLKMKNSVKLVFDKKCGGINMLLGLGQGISATCSFVGKQNDTLSVNFSDGDWTGKIIGLVAGWFLCLVPFITAIIGSVRQMSLPKDISNDMQTTLSNME